MLGHRFAVMCCVVTFLLALDPGDDENPRACPSVHHSHYYYYSTTHPVLSFSKIYAKSRTYVNLFEHNSQLLFIYCIYSSSEDLIITTKKNMFFTTSFIPKRTPIYRVNNSSNKIEGSRAGQSGKDTKGTEHDL